jgi:hypothetical protein
MIAALISVLSDAWPALLAGLVAIGSLLWGWASNQKAKTATAQAKQKEAEAAAHAAQVDAIAAKANEDAARAGANNAKVRRDEDSAAAGEPDANRVLRDEWGK